MLRRQVFTLFAAVVLAAGFAWGLTHLFALRLEHGDTYPPYSTLRTDPLGAKAIFDAFQAQSGLTASRNYLYLPRLHAEHPVTIIYAGVPVRSAWGEDELQTFDSMISAGSRAVFTFRPESVYLKTYTFGPEHKDSDDKDKSKEEKKADEKAKDKEPEKKDASKEKSAKDAKPKEKEKDAKAKDNKEEKKDSDSDEDEPDRTRFFDVAKIWGFRFEVQRGEGHKPYKSKAVLEDAASRFEPEISWHSALYFTDLKPVWKVLYKCDGKPVVIERPWGRGSILLASDSYFVSNEALRSERVPRLLASFAGPSTVLFDEQHQGVQEEPNMAGLVRKYRLTGAMAALLVVAGLFVWQHVVRFVPGYESSASEGDLVAGQGLAEGFVNLLRRTIAPSEIIGICAAEWRKAFGQKQADVSKFNKAWAQTGEMDAVSAYTAVSAALAQPSAPSPTTSKKS